MLSQNVNPTERAMIRTIRATRMATQMMIYTNFYNAKHHNHSHHISIIVIIIIIIIIIIVFIVIIVQNVINYSHCKSQFSSIAESVRIPIPY